MKKNQRPTLKQKKAIKAAGLNPENWLIERDTPSKMVIVHRNTSTIKEIRKGA